MRPFILAAVLLLALGAFAQVWSQGVPGGVSLGGAKSMHEDTQPASSAPSPDADRGKQIATKGIGCGTGQTDCYPCYFCHGREGTGSASPPIPRLAGQSYLYLYQSLLAFAEGRRDNETMKQVAHSLSQQAMRDVSAYYAKVQPETNIQAGAAEALRNPDYEAVVRGGILVSVGDWNRGIQACANCHGPNAIGLPPVYPFLSGQYAEYLEDQLQAFKQGKRGDDRFGIMQDLARRMTDQQIHDVSQYLASIRPVTHPPQGTLAGSSSTEPSSRSLQKDTEGRR